MKKKTIVQGLKKSSEEDSTVFINDFIIDKALFVYLFKQSKSNDLSLYDVLISC